MIPILTTSTSKTSSYLPSENIIQYKQIGSLNKVFFYGDYGPETDSALEKKICKTFIFTESCLSDYTTGTSESTSTFHPYYEPTGTTCFFQHNVVPIAPSAVEKMRAILRNRLAPRIFVPSHRRPVSRLPITDEREIRAQDTLRRVLGEKKFRGFLKNGFVSVMGKSGKIYLLYAGSTMTVVMDKGKPVEKLCVVLSGGFAPTDFLIMRYLMLLNDEKDFRARCKVWGASSLNQFTVEKEDFSDTIADVFKRFKMAS